MVSLLKKSKSEQKTTELDFILSHNLYSRAEVAPTDRVLFHFKVFLLIQTFRFAFFSNI